MSSSPDDAFEPLTTSRLSLRRFSGSDLTDYMGYQGLPEVRRHLHGAAMTEEAARSFLARQAASRGDERGRYQALAVVHRSDRRVIGDVGAFLPLSPDDEGDIGFQFHPAYHGRGFAIEAVGALIEHLFTRLGLRRLTAGCDRANVASSRLLERAGMRRLEDTDDGSLSYELTRETWVSSRRAG